MAHGSNSRCRQAIYQRLSGRPVVNDLKPLNVSLQKFSADMFDTAAQGAYQAMCDQLNILLEQHPDDEARLTLLHDQAVQVRDMIAHQGKLIAKVYQLAQAQQQIAQ